MSTNWLERVLRPIGRIDSGWLRDLLPADALNALLRRAAGERRHATRLLAQQLHALGTRPPWGGAVDAPAWLAAPPEALQRIAVQLGARARLAWLRTQVAPQAVAALVAVLGADGYRRLLSDTALNVETPSPEPATMAAPQLVPHLMSWGAALLERHLGAASPATRFRLRLVLPPPVWTARPRDLTIAADELAAAVQAAAPTP